jgi:hypothetical protein
VHSVSRPFELWPPSLNGLWREAGGSAAWRLGGSAARRHSLNRSSLIDVEDGDGLLYRMAPNFVPWNCGELADWRLDVALPRVREAR